MMKKIALILLCAGTGVALVFDSAGVSDAVSRTVTLCLNTIVPSLFAFLALSSFVSSGIVKGEAAIFTLSLAGGYPVGAKLLSDRVKSDPLYAKRAEQMLMYCYCGSPAFLLTVAGHLGLYVWFSNVLACVIFAVFANVFRKRGSTPVRTPCRDRSVRISGQVLVESVAGAGAALYRICLMMLVFAVLLRFLEFIGIMRLLPAHAYAVAEITNVMHLNTHPALLAALTSIGGLCVIFQTTAIVGGRFGCVKFILARIPVAVMSGGIAHLLTHSLTVQTLVTNRRPEMSSGGSMIASLCLLVMTLFLISCCQDSSVQN
jgi:hypothetical protein